MIEKASLMHELGSHPAELTFVHHNSELQHRLFVYFHFVFRNLAIYVLLMICMALASIGAIIYGKSLMAGIILGLFALIIPISMLLTAYLYSKRYIAKHQIYLYCQNTYKFFSQYLYIYTEHGQMSGETVKRYDEIYRVYETPLNLYLYISKSRTVILVKDQIASGDLNKLYDILEEKIQKKRIRSGFLCVFHTFRRVRISS